MLNNSYTHTQMHVNAHTNNKHWHKSPSGSHSHSVTIFTQILPLFHKVTTLHIVTGPPRHSKAQLLNAEILLLLCCQVPYNTYSRFSVIRSLVRRSLFVLILPLENLLRSVCALHFDLSYLLVYVPMWVTHVCSILRSFDISSLCFPFLPFYLYL